MFFGEVLTQLRIRHSHTKRGRKSIAGFLKGHCTPFFFLSTVMESQQSVLLNISHRLIGSPSPHYKFSLLLGGGVHPVLLRVTPNFALKNHSRFQEWDARNRAQVGLCVKQMPSPLYHLSLWPLCELFRSLNSFHLLGENVPLH